jgi:hypothetical protein
VLSKFGGILFSQPKEILTSYTGAQLLAGLIGSIYFINNRSQSKSRYTTLNFSMGGFILLILFITYISKSLKPTFLTLFFCFAFLIIEFYKYNGINRKVKLNGIWLLEFLLIFSITCCVFLISNTDRVILLILLGLLISHFTMKLGKVTFGKITHLGMDILFILPIAVSQLSTYCIFLYPSTYMSESSYIDLRSSLAFLSLGGLFSSLTLIIVARNTFTMSKYIIVFSLMTSIILWLFSNQYSYLLLLIISGIYNGLNREALTPKGFAIVSTISPLLVIIFTFTGFQNVISIVFWSYCSHVILSLIFHHYAIFNRISGSINRGIC